MTVITKNILKEKGHIESFARFALYFILCLMLLFSLYLALDQCLLTLYGSRDSVDINYFRTIGAKIWRMFYRFETNPFLLILPALMFLSIFIAQSGLKPSKAKRFNLICMLTIFALAFYIFIAFAYLMVVPMCFFVSH